MGSEETSWLVAPDIVRPTPDEVHVWRAELDRSPSYVQKLLLTLAADERDRAERFHFERDRTHFIVARGTLRAILSRYVNAEPGRLRFRYSDHGKPSLIEEQDGDSISFNVSHSHALALFAITQGRAIGVDLEWIRPDIVNDEIAERFFSAQEVGALRELPEGERGEAFFRCWTRKEAYIKARGEGLSMPLDRFAVSLNPGERAALLATEDDPQEASRWSLRALNPGPDFEAALAVEGSGWRLKCWQWPEE